MNFYAINVAPLNGYETQFAAGEGAVVVAATGDGKRAALGASAASITLTGQATAVLKNNAAGAATIQVAATGNGKQAALGASSASIVLTTTGNGKKASLGAGQGALALTATGAGLLARKGAGASSIQLDGTASAILKAAGRGAASISIAGQSVERLASLGRGDATITLTLEGFPSAVYFGTGHADIVLAGEGKGAFATLAEAQALIEFGGRYGIPNTLPVPALYHEAPFSRWVTADADPRKIHVQSTSPGDARTIRADGDLRLIRVAPEPILPVRENRRAPIQHEGRQA